MDISRRRLRQAARNRSTRLQQVIPSQTIEIAHTQEVKLVPGMGMERTRKGVPGMLTEYAKEIESKNGRQMSGVGH